MRNAMLAACLLAACGDNGRDLTDSELAGSWTITRTIESRTPECISGQPGDSGSTGSITIDPSNESKPVTAPDSSRSEITDGVVSFSTYETVDGFGTIGGTRLTYDVDSDRLVGTGSLGCGTGCFYELQAIGERE